MNDILVVDEFLNEKNFKEIQNIFLGQSFPWYYNDSKTYENDKDFQFVHMFYAEKKIQSDYFNCLSSFIEEINPFEIIRIKMNLTTHTYYVKKYPLHSDNQDPEVKSVIYYINTNNGYSFFEGISNNIASFENRAVFFSSKLRHSGTSTSDSKIRVVLNMVYREQKK